jgi:hypothetical protein
METKVKDFRIARKKENGEAHTLGHDNLLDGVELLNRGDKQWINLENVDVAKHSPTIRNLRTTKKRVLLCR